MEVEEKPTEDYSMVGGLDKQIEELIEAVVLPITHKDRFKSLGIKPPKGVLMFGPPGTGKTLLARACAAKTAASFMKISAPQLVQVFYFIFLLIYIRCILVMVLKWYVTHLPLHVKKRLVLYLYFYFFLLFIDFQIDELDAIGTKRFDSDKSGDREVQRTMLELLNQLDGFSSDTDVKVIAATNRPDILDPGKTFDLIILLILFQLFYALAVQIERLNFHYLTNLLVLESCKFILVK